MTSSWYASARLPSPCPCRANFLPLPSPSSPLPRSLQITYHLSPLRDLLQKPLAIAAVLGLVFGAIIFAKQLDWAIPGAVVVVEGGKGKGKVE